MFNMLNGLSVEISWDNYKPFNLDKWPFLPFVHFLLINFLTFDYCARLQAGLPFVVYPIFSAIDLLGIYQALKHVHLQTLTKVSRHWLLMSDYLMYVCKLSPTTLIITLIHAYTRTIYLSLGNFSLINTWPSHSFTFLYVQDRLEIILDKWIESGHVPSPAEVSKDEGIDFLWSKGVLQCFL